MSDYEYMIAITQTGDKWVASVSKVRVRKPRALINVANFRNTSLPTITLDVLNAVADDMAKEISE